MQVIRLLVIGWLLAPLLRQPVAAQALDPTFTPPSSLYAPGKVYAMAAQQADGKRVLAGDFSRVNNVAVGTLIRLDAAGALDQTFAQNVGLAVWSQRIGEWVNRRVAFKDSRIFTPFGANEFIGSQAF
jgi:hypothetical protein